MPLNADGNNKFQERMQLAQQCWTQFGSDTNELKAEREKQIKTITACQDSQSPYRQTVAVIGWGGSDEERHNSLREKVEQLASEVGGVIAECEMNILTGGGLCVMKSAVDGFLGKNPKGLAFAVRPAKYCVLPEDSRAKYINTKLEGNILDWKLNSKPLGPSSRNHVNILCADRIVVLYGEGGTRAEMMLAGRDWYDRPARAVDCDCPTNQADIDKWRAAVKAAGIQLVAFDQLKNWLCPGM